MNEPNKKNLLDELLEGITPEEQEKKDKKMILSTKIANAIKAKGLKKSEFAEILGKQPSEISKWLSGTHNFTIDTLMDIERVLSIQLLDTGNWDSVENIRSEFQKLFEQPPEEQIEHRAKMLSYIFLSEVQKAMDRKKWTRKQLAEEIGMSASYLTQLYRGDRLLNFKTVAKIEAALDINFSVSVSQGTATYQNREDLNLDSSQVNQP